MCLTDKINFIEGEGASSFVVVIIIIIILGTSLHGLIID